MSKHFGFILLSLGLIFAGLFAINSEAGTIDGLFMSSIVCLSVGVVIVSHHLYEDEEGDE